MDLLCVLISVKSFVVLVALIVSVSYERCVYRKLKYFDLFSVESSWPIHFTAFGQQTSANTLVYPFQITNLE